jgi:RNase P subunit RPR2
VKKTPLKRKTAIKKSGKPKAKPRSKIDFMRIYGSKTRVEFVKKLPCTACNSGPCENAHIKSGGMGRKADYTDIIPLCKKCHALQHQKGWKGLGLNAMLLEAAALRTQWLWVTRAERGIA